MRTYKDIYQLPFHTDMGWCRDAKGQFAFQFQFDSTLLRDNILQIINGKEKPTKGKVFSHEDGYIVDEQGKDYILIRGWGMMQMYLCN